MRPFVFAGAIALLGACSRPEAAIAELHGHGCLAGGSRPGDARNDVAAGGSGALIDTTNARFAADDFRGALEAYRSHTRRCAGSSGLPAWWGDFNGRQHAWRFDPLPIRRGGCWSLEESKPESGHGVAPAMPASPHGPTKM
ncbi:MAG: hypothetical protein IPK85_15205 [Gemmatimonadetes bacterium]|nr:hypothetical protein [Gemmatimonadota bacterium]